MMRLRKLHSWDVTLAEAKALQEKLSGMVERRNGPGLGRRPRLIGGVDVACPSSHPVAVAVVVVMTRPGMEVVEVKGAVARLRFPYIPGFLSFREGEAVARALELVAAEVECFIFDGQGICHPRRLGLASHLGLLLERPAIGCAKSLLLGHDGAPSPRRGSRRQIRDGTEVVGCALRTRQGVKPVYVSIGHLVDLPTATGIILSSCSRYRLPEPQREAHRRVTALSRDRSTLEAFINRGSPTAPLEGPEQWS